MTTKINSLSDRQVSQIAAYREKWIIIGSSIEPTDIPAAEDAVRQCYKLAGVNEPRSIICADSPLNAITGSKHVINQLSNQLSNQVYDRVSSQIYNKIYNKIYNQVYNQVYNKVYNQVSNKVWNQVWNQVGNQVWNQVWNHINNQVRNHINNQVRNHRRMQFGQFYGCHDAGQFYGCHDAGWLAPYDYFREVCGLVKETEEITGLIALAKCCGWWAPYKKDVTVIQHRPCFIALDDEKRLHCESGMAIEYRDGFGVWYIHGVWVDEQIVMKPGEQTVKQITEEKNAEVKRIRIERFGWNRYLTEIGAKIINRRHNDIENTEEVLVKTPDGMTILLPTCKTGRLFSLEVPSDVLTCEQAQKWLHGGSQLDKIVGKTRVVGRS